MVSLALLALLMVPAVLNAEGDGSDPSGIVNPLTCSGCDDLAGLLIAIVGEVVKVGFYIVVFFIIYAGFLFVTARGDTTKLEKAKTTFLYTVIGAAILLGATVLATVIKNTVDQLEARHVPVIDISHV